MFQDTWKIKVKAVLLPVLIWIAAGAVGELIGASLYALFYSEGIQYKNFFFALSANVSGAHLKWDALMVAFRNIASLPFFIHFYKKDCRQIQDRHQVKMEGLLLPFLGIGFCLFVNLLFSLIHFTDFVVVTEQSLQNNLGDPSVYVMLCTQILLAPITEEYLLRGIVYRRLRTYKGVLFATFLSSLIFAVLHWNIAQLVYAFVLGIVLCDIFETTRRVWCCILVHGFANLCACVVGFVPEVNQFVSEKPIQFCVGGIVLFLIARVLFAVFIGKGRVGESI